MEEILNDVVSKLRVTRPLRPHVMMQNRREVRRPDDLADDLVAHLLIGENDDLLDHVAAVLLAGVLHDVSERRPDQQLALVGTGIVTSIPLVLFTFAAMNLPMNVLGFCQYLSPILTLLLGIFWFNEPFGREELLPLLFIWSGILVFCAAEVREMRAAKKA